VVVTGHAQPGATLRLRDMDDPTRTVVRTTVVRSDGTFSFDLSGVAPSGLTAGHVVVVQGRPVDHYEVEDRVTVLAPKRIHLPIIFKGAESAPLRSS